MDKTEYEAMLKAAFASEFSFFLKAANFHWNVEGSLFPQYHELFGKIYGEVYGSIDTFAEELRALRIYAPAAFETFDEHQIGFLDEDELNHWGRIIKYFHIITNSEINKIPEIYLYHQPFLPVIHFFNSFVSGFREDISIFSNNLFLISSFYFLFYQEKISFYKRIFLFAILKKSLHFYYMYHYIAMLQII